MSTSDTLRRLLVAGATAAALAEENCRKAREGKPSMTPSTPPVGREPITHELTTWPEYFQAVKSAGPRP